MARTALWILALCCCASTTACAERERASPLDATVHVTGAGLAEKEGRRLSGQPTLTDSARLDSLHAVLQNPAWETFEFPSPSYTYSIKLWSDTTVVGILAVGPEYLIVLPVDRDPRPTRRRLTTRERQMLDRWFGIE